MRCFAGLIAAALALGGCAQTLSVAPVESIPPLPPPLPKEAPPPVIDAIPADQIDVVSTSERPAGSAVIEMTIRRSEGCKSGPCLLQIWKNGLVAFVNTHGTSRNQQVGWSHVRSSDVSRWLSAAALNPPSTKSTRGRRSCRNYSSVAYGEITFHTGDRTVSIRANDPCNSKATQAMVEALVAAGPLQEPQH